MANIKASDTLEIICASIITNEDRRSLARLYEPIIGSDAFSLYLTLSYELDGERTIETTPKNFDRLAKLTNLNMQEIDKALIKLEGLGLTRRFIKEDNKGIAIKIVLYAPLSPKQFFDHDILSNMFRSVMGDEEANRTIMYFSQLGRISSKYLEVSASFKKAYGGFDFDSKEEINNKTVGRKAGYPNLDFDFDLFYEGLKEYQISKKIINKTIENEIKVLANAYNISVYDMRNIVIASLDNDGKVNIAKLEAKCRNNASFDNTNSVKQEKPLQLSGDLSLDQKIELLAKMEPIEYLSAKYRGKKPLKSDVILISELQKNSGLSNGVINVIVDYALFKNDNRLSGAYLERLAGSIIRANIDDPYEAMMFLNKTSKKKIVTTKEENKVESNDSDENVLDAINRIKALRNKEGN